MTKLLLNSILILTLFSCDYNNSDSEMLYLETIDDMLNIPYTEQAGDVADFDLGVKKFISTGGFEFQSENIESDYTAILGILPKYNAYVERENKDKSESRINYNLNIRVESNSYDSLYNQLNTFAKLLDNKYSNLEDVTERYYDLKSRIKNKKALEERYITLLNKTTTIKEILEIEKNLNDIRTEIERLEGQYQQLNQQIKFSTIYLEFYEIRSDITKTSRERFGSRIVDSMSNGWQGLLTFIVWLSGIWPLVLIISLLIYFIKKWKNGLKKKSQG